MTRPLVTISVLVYGPSPWLPQVLDAVVEHTAVPYELVIVDNGTNDETRAHIAGVDGARVLRPEHNLGFGVGHNAAANIARGDYLCTLNSDAIVPPGWLDALVAPLAADPQVGATAPAYVYPDGRLQEAGATVEPSGQVIAFGRFDDATKREHRVAGRVPFASAACLVTRTTTFRELGGFDARYGVAYYEDVELAFALLDRGLHLELVAGVQVVHAQGASSETSGDAERLLLGNREHFRERWEPLLAGRPFVFNRPEAHHLAAARDFDACDRVLIVADAVAEPDDHSFAVRLVKQCRARLRDGRITVAARGSAPSLATRDRWLERGVEAVDAADVAALLTARRFHFAAVVVVPPASPGLDRVDHIRDVVRTTQPQAHVADAPAPATLDSTAAFDRWLGSLDLISRLVS